MGVLRACQRSIPSTLTRLTPTASFSVSTPSWSQKPKPTLELDPSLKALLRDVDISLANHKSQHTLPRPRELEFWSTADTGEKIEAEELEFSFVPHDLDVDAYDNRKSPAAEFGSLRLGQVQIPFELQNSINKLIAESDKDKLHQDAKRLFFNERSSGGRGPEGWDSAFNVHYRSRQQRDAMGERDGTAFASIAMPAHYAAIYAVLDHLKVRLGPEWSPQHFMDWQASTGSGLWAALTAFQREELISWHNGNGRHPALAESTVKSYRGFEKREGLTAISKRLLSQTQIGDIDVAWTRAYQEEYRRQPEDGADVVALSAFALSSLPSPLARKDMVKEMWDSGASMIILIDHNTRDGFEHVLEAREQILRMGEKELEDPDTTFSPLRGAHVVAPCPHDGRCPLHHPGQIQLVCGFSQRQQRPDFVRLTKHSGVGHEDVGYSYVAIRRGPRPSVLKAPRTGRIGLVGRWDLEKTLTKLTESPPTELVAQSDASGEERDVHATADQPVNLAREAEIVEVEEALAQETSDRTEGVQHELRQEAYHWPRLIFPPLKRSGHIILDACTPEGRIMRMTVPKSQGKQPYYDARKSEWGDIFPHPPKNPPQERYQPPSRALGGKSASGRDADTGKRGQEPTKNKSKNSYTKSVDAARKKEKETRKSRIEALKMKDAE